MPTHTMTIDGQAVKGSSTTGVINPATGQVFAEVPDCSKAELDLAMDAAQRAFPAWSRDFAARRKVLNDIAGALMQPPEGLARTLTMEQGKPLDKAAQEVMLTAMWCGYTASLDIPAEVLLDNEAGRIEVRRKPLGVVAAITPWNYPLMLAMWKIAPALLAGNTVVLKPSPFTPMSTLMLGEILRDIVPPGVLNVVSGGDGLGAMMTSHPVPRKISFTGSVETGKKVAAAAAPDLKRVTLELGGNDPAIVLADADLKEVAPKIFWGAFENSGQICSAIKRVYVPEEMYAPMMDILAEMARGVKVGDGLEAGTQLGPINNLPQFERVTELVEDARAHGAHIITGGERIGSEGYFFAPTIVGEISDGVRLVDEEQFGPALPVIPYKDVADVLRRANATHYGLSGSVWSRDPSRGAEVAAQLECGSAWVNQHLAIAPNLPFGGAKWSGIGVENGPWGLLSFTEIQVVNVAKN
ncbi:MAG: aldehyde dehydrogenase family protein [Candidatus Binatus sp.]|uniref:aldehyde dehydrogenase family protein n=1 Tax=Candidatus Binatus sp. TaxID=2811406 RepID=UPI00271F070F|nr:aldehyde dehydrogenase family protein [Candidatus Binatus sp.]MDO8430935.1 aldehyde dehydrogenase family protein [Candidatus Binatus sp.]